MTWNFNTESDFDFRTTAKYRCRTTVLMIQTCDRRACDWFIGLPIPLTCKGGTLRLYQDNKMFHVYMSGWRAAFQDKLTFVRKSLCCVSQRRCSRTSHLIGEWSRNGRSGSKRRGPLTFTLFRKLPYRSALTQQVLLSVPDDVVVVLSRHIVCVAL